MDRYTGRPRPAQSLSGGETFLASLALALGLAEVVTGRAGGITPRHALHRRGVRRARRRDARRRDAHARRAAPGRPHGRCHQPRRGHEGAAARAAARRGHARGLERGPPGSPCAPGRLEESLCTPIARRSSCAARPAPWGHRMRSGGAPSVTPSTGTSPSPMSQRCESEPRHELTHPGASRPRRLRRRRGRSPVGRRSSPRRSVRRACRCPTKMAAIGRLHLAGHHDVLSRCHAAPPTAGPSARRHPSTRTRRACAALGRAATTYNNAVTSVKSAGLPGSGDRRPLAQGATYVTMQIGANDACTSTVGGMTPPATFDANVRCRPRHPRRQRRAAGHLRRQRPEHQAPVGGQPHQHERATDLGGCSGSASRCSPTRAARPPPTWQRRDAVQARVNEYNAMLAAACAATPSASGTATPSRTTVHQGGHLDPGLLPPVRHGAGRCSRT